MKALKMMNRSLSAGLLEFLTPSRLFARLNIASKMLMGYMTLVVLTVVVVVYVLLNLKQLNDLNNEIVNVDIPTQEAADNMLDALFAQDTYEKRSLVLNNDDIKILFKKRHDEFEKNLLVLEKLPGHSLLYRSDINRLHAQYGKLFAQEIRFIKEGDSSQAMQISNRELKHVFNTLQSALKKISADAQLSQDAKMKKISTMGKTAFFRTLMLCFMSIALGVVSSMVVTRYITSSIIKLRDATVQIAEGNFQYDPRITSKDEVGALAMAFVSMGKRLGKLEEMYLDASPLTRLPGGIAIENVLKRRIASGQPLAFCMLDLDNFKAFNDQYGYAHGNKVIKETARIIETATAEKGTADDFVGHIGGDDFVVITTPQHMREISAEVIKNFDHRIKQFYSAEDQAKGFMLGKSRQGQEMQFPLMTISIAIVTNEQRIYSNPLEASELAAELKDYAKTIPSSVYVVDKRRMA